MIDIKTAERIVGSFLDTSFQCPHCGEQFDGAECETAQQVVSYWGEEPHDFSCEQCGQDFLVKETVMRSFEVAKTHEGLGE